MSPKFMEQRHGNTQNNHLQFLSTKRNFGMNRHLSVLPTISASPIMVDCVYPDLLAHEEKNFNTLTNYLRGRLKGFFDIEHFTGDPEKSETDTDCGTVGCALGHAPYAGISKRPGQHWWDYYLENFNQAYTPECPEVFRWSFHNKWVYVDNTPLGAAARIEHMLKFGIPVDWERQMDACAPLSYTHLI